MGALAPQLAEQVDGRARVAERPDPEEVCDIGVHLPFAIAYASRRKPGRDDGLDSRRGNRSTWLPASPRPHCPAYHIRGSR